MDTRILSLFLPRLASNVHQRREKALKTPFALIARQGRGDVLACLSLSAEALGVRRGQSLSEARTLLPTLTTRPYDPEWPLKALNGLRRWALRYAPWIAVDGSDGLAIDLTGAAHLGGGEAALVQDMRARLADMGFETRVAVAPTRGAAWGLARHAPASVTLAAEAREAIATLPLAALRLPAEICLPLSRLGIRQVQDLARAPRATLARRFGGDLLLRYDQAIGAVGEPVAAPPEDAPYAIRLNLPEPIGLATDVMAGLERLLVRLCARLSAEDHGARRLHLELQRSDGTRAEAEIALARPMRDAPAMAALFARAIEALDAGFGFDALRLTAPLVESLPPAQVTGTQGAGARGTTDSDALADLMTRLGNRLGLEALTRFLPADSHIPERGFQIAAAAYTEAPGPAAWPPGPDRPLVLFPPEPLIGLRGSAPPQRFRWRRRALTAARTTGPERLTPEWWLDDPGWRSGVRDYWRIDTAEGPRLWLFFTPQDPGWWVQGEFA
ncbi:Y-family DNA polymerase [Pararhodobacter zhoushanensis]|uniref:DNA-directed DNA polymerase n=1 Tax=Pararhodobacter zhoushanensis TaxID=2479545 RepID=A0ABT3GTI5_9RHOB|nr:DNA polymerase Y family protein [Pararhodobacter zhoushanensis]MCW1930840.1 DNA polymerase Y family protein [Pararhodobacter zhoushanensis]